MVREHVPKAGVVVDDHDVRTMWISGFARRMDGALPGLDRGRRRRLRSDGRGAVTESQQGVAHRVQAGRDLLHDLAPLLAESRVLLAERGALTLQIAQGGLRAIQIVEELGEEGGSVLHPPRESFASFVHGDRSCCLRCIVSEARSIPASLRRAGTALCAPSSYFHTRRAARTDGAVSDAW